MEKPHAEVYTKGETCAEGEARAGIRVAARAVAAIPSLGEPPRDTPHDEAGEDRAQAPLVQPTGPLEGAAKRGVHAAGGAARQPAVEAAAADGAAVPDAAEPFHAEQPGWDGGGENREGGRGVERG